MNRILPKHFIVFILLLAILSINSMQNAYAIDGSRFFTGVLFISGLGASFAGAIIQGQANSVYDDYLHSAVQSDMDRLIDDYDKKNQQSMIASRVGIGLTITAIVISLFDAQSSEDQKVNSNLSSKYILPEIKDTNVKNGDIRLGIRDHF